MRVAVVAGRVVAAAGGRRGRRRGGARARRQAAGRAVAPAQGRHALRRAAAGIVPTKQRASYYHHMSNFTSTEGHAERRTYPAIAGFDCELDLDRELAVTFNSSSVKVCMGGRPTMRFSNVASIQEVCCCISCLCNVQ